MSSNIRAVAVAIAASAALCAGAQQLKPEDQLKLRKAAYSLMGYTIESLDAAAGGKKPWLPDEVVREAELLAQLARVPKGFFGEGTDKGETRAKPEIWTKRADFDAKMDKMVTEVSRLPQVARTSDPAALKKAVKDVDDACKACHDDYRVRRRG